MFPFFFLSLSSPPLFGRLVRFILLFSDDRPKRDSLIPKEKKGHSRTSVLYQNSILINLERGDSFGERERPRHSITRTRSGFSSVLYIWRRLQGLHRWGGETSQGGDGNLDGWPACLMPESWASHTHTSFPCRQRRLLWIMHYRR